MSLLDGALPPDEHLLPRPARGEVIKATWGEVLGVREYKLYRRRKGEQSFKVIYQGLERKFTDNFPDVIRAFSNPGAASDALRSAPGYTIYDYAVATLNGNGESKLSLPVSTDPANWLNWDPKPGEPFCRSVSARDAPYDESQPSCYLRK